MSIALDNIMTTSSQYGYVAGAEVRVVDDLIKVIYNAFHFLLLDYLVMAKKLFFLETCLHA